MLKKLVVRIRDLDEKYPQELKRQLDAFQDARKTAPDPDRYNGITTAKQRGQGCMRDGRWYRWQPGIRRAMVEYGPNHVSLMNA